jgi:hypothetical protein
MNRLLMTALALGLFLAPACASAADKKAEDGWVKLFNGKDLTGWTNASGKKPGWVIRDGALCRTRGAGDIWTKQRYGDFVLDLEFKTKGNSGIFIRTDNMRNNVQTGIEIQVDNPGGPGKHSVGAVYDALAPSKNVGKKDDWNHVTITARGSNLTVVMNGEKIIDMDLDRWSEAGKNPDGSKNKYRHALKNFKREGHIGFQDHGADVCYRNVKIKPLEKK